MNSFNPLFDASEVSTPAGMAPVISADAVSGVPSQGTGLNGEVYITNGPIWNIGVLEEIIAEHAPISTFTATQLLYAGNRADTTVSEFLAHDADSIEGIPGDIFEMGPSGLKFTGYVYIPEGIHEIAVYSDDGFKLSIGGVEFSEFEDGRGADVTARVAEFEGGLYEVELLYFDGGGGQALSFQIDGVTVDPSAFYQSTDDFTNPPADVPLVAVEDYHPSLFIDEALERTSADTPTEGIDNIQGGGADESIDGLGGDDWIHGGYGDDSINGGAGDDVLNGGRGADLVIGGDGDDIIISDSDGAEQRIGQLAIGAPTRPDSPEGEVNEERQKLKGYEDQPLVSDDILVGGEGRDLFLFKPQINGKLEIIEQHVRRDGTINWAGVAGENTYLHDHWVDLFGIDIIADFVKGEDQIAVIGHTATIHSIDYRDTDGDGDIESIVTVLSNQHGNGGAHDDDLIGQFIVHGDLVEEDDIITDAGVTYGIVEGYADVAEALFPEGDLKVTEINGELVYGYDTREGADDLGPITGAPEDFVDNPFLAEVEFGDPSAEGYEETRYPFEQLGTAEAEGQSLTGTGADETLAPVFAEPEGLPGALAFYDFADPDGVADGAYEDARGGPAAKAYTLYENTALLRTDGLTTGPDGVTLNALEFNGEDEFAFIAHATNLAVTQGTIALFVRPDDLEDNATFLSKDESGLDDGGHFRLGHTDEGQLFMRFADGDGRWGNQSWETTGPALTEGTWHHIAVNFQADGITVFVDGVAIPDNEWVALDGDTPTPGQHTEAYLLQNEEPWVLGADSHRSKLNDTAQVFAADDDKLDRAFDGAIAELGIWGGYTPEDALTPDEIAELILNGPGTALTNPSGPQPMIASDDQIDGAGGNDTIEGGAGNDTLDGGAGDDSIEGGYGDDLVRGGAGNDTLDGGRGNDFVQGGDGDDLLYARSDAGEQRLGQLVLGEPSREFPDPSIDPTYLKLVDWIDQPLAADDVLEGGAGADTFYIQTQINGKKDIILKHIQDDRTVKWHGVAGENRRLHDHWVDLFGIDIIADFNREEDQIKIIGHTTNILDISYKTYDSDGDGVDDDAMSIVQVYSQQGKNGGAHDEDMLGYVVVFGDLVTEDDIETDAGAHFGIVTTVDEIQEALAPTGETKISFAPDGTEIFGYDSRDIEGNPLAADPVSYSSNPFLAAGDVELGSSLDDLPPAVVLQSSEGGTFDGIDDVLFLDHLPELAQESGTWAFSFTANTPGEGEQVLISKDHAGLQAGGHLSFYVGGDGYFRVRFQSTDENRHLKFRDEKIEAGQEYSVAFTFDADTIALYIDGELVDADDGFPDGMTGNPYSTAVGASTRLRWEDDPRLNDFFNGEIADIAVYDRVLEPVEVVLLSDSGASPALERTGPVYGDEADNVLTGTEDADDIYAGAGNDKVDGAGSDDMVDLGAGDDTADGGEGTDTLSFASLEAPELEINGLTFGVVADLSNQGTAQQTGQGMDMFTGFENIEGSDYNDGLFGDDADNLLDGGDGRDFISGGAGNDTLEGGGDYDVLDGGEGADTLFGGTSDEEGAIETDLAAYFGASGPLVFDFGATYSVLEARSSAMLLEDFIGADIEGIAGASGYSNTFHADQMTGLTFFLGGSESDTFFGGSGTDQLLGLGGADVMYGNDGQDALIGGAGDDDLFGGAGRDFFFFDNANGGNDIIHDLELALDVLQFAPDAASGIEDLEFSTLDADGDGVSDGQIKFMSDGAVSTVTVLGVDGVTLGDQANFSFG